jgi:Elongation factor G-binding protein, N-terminal/FBP C-terminal treble-clef zinc-finger
MEAFIRNDQFNFIKTQGEYIVHAYATVHDQGVLKAAKLLALEKTAAIFEEPLSIEQEQLITQLENISERKQLEDYLQTVVKYVFSFPSISEKALKKLFPKNKKIKLNSLHSNEDQITYLGWDDLGTNSKLLIVPMANKLIGLQGNFQTAEKKGVCAICRKIGKVGFFTAEIKGNEAGTFIKRGNYICSDSYECNQKIQLLQPLEEFVQLMTQR